MKYEFMHGENEEEKIIIDGDEIAAVSKDLPGVLFILKSGVKIFIGIYEETEEDIKNGTHPTRTRDIYDPVSTGRNMYPLPVKSILVE